jgi:hypothetical protein
VSNTALAHRSALATLMPVPAAQQRLIFFLRDSLVNISYPDKSADQRIGADQQSRNIVTPQRDDAR